MGYREPCTTIYLFKGCPCDKSYNNTIYFTDKSTQWIYFRDHFGNGRTVAYRNQSYQRFAKGTLRIMERADNLYEFNYMAFCNDLGFNPLVGPTGNMKIFYCFIDSITYINENVTEVKYTIDVIQTYMFNYKLGMCFVEREHTETDYVGDNLISEDLDVGELIVQRKIDFMFPNYMSTNTKLVDYNVIVFYTPNEKYIYGWDDTNHQWDVRQWTPYTGRGDYIGGVYNGCLFQTVGCDITNTTARDTARHRIDSLIDDILVKCKGEIVNIIQIPSSMYEKWVNEQTTPWGIALLQENKFPNSPHNKNYEAKNKKLLSYPYQRIILSNNAGNTGEFKWEEFNMYSAGQQTATVMSGNFNIDSIPVVSPQTVCYPINYRGITNDYENGILLTEFPMAAWSEDSFAKWWASNQNSYTIGILNSVISGALTIAGGALMATGVGAAPGAAMTGLGFTTAQVAGMGTAIAGAASTSSSILNAMGTYSDKKALPDQIKGQVGNSSLNVMQGRLGYTFYIVTLNYERAKAIDDYFTMFGYAVKQVKIPNIFKPNAALRPHWNYIKNMKTVVLPIISNNNEHYVELDVEEKLQEIYNNGITFWMDGEEVGDYTYDNRPV